MTDSTNGAVIETRVPARLDRLPVRQPDQLRKIREVATGFLIGAVVMAVGGHAEVFLGVRSEQRALEDIAEPLTVEDAEQEPADDRQRQPRPPRRARLRPDPRRSSAGWPGMPLSAPSRTVPTYEREVDQIVRTLRQRGVTRRGELGRAVGARSWETGRFGDSLRAAQQQGQARRLARARYEATSPDGASRPPGRSEQPSTADARPPEQSPSPRPSTNGETAAAGEARARPRDTRAESAGVVRTASPTTAAAGP